jgi:hypothetical protein
LRAQGLLLASFWAYFAGDYGAARRLSDECLALSQRIHSGLFVGQALVVSGLLEVVEGRDDWAARAEPLCEAAERCLRDARDPAVLARQLSNIAHILRVAGELTSSMAKVTEAVGLARTLGDTWLMAATLTHLAELEFDSGRHAAAEERWKEALSLAASIRTRQTVMSISIGLARLAAVREMPGARVPGCR